MWTLESSTLSSCALQILRSTSKTEVDAIKFLFRLFAYFSTFPGKQSYPTGCLWSLRVWLRVNGVDHRIFGEDELWVGRDPDFNSITEASFARLKAAEGDRQLYNAYVGKALVTFVVKYAQTLFSRFDA